MQEELLSVGIDLGTSTTQLIFSRLRIENMAGSYMIPRMAITKKEVCYKSEIYFTPLKDQATIDFVKVREIVEQEYARAGIHKEEIDTGAVIITGETARKENAREVAETLSGFAGDFVVATAGPDLESVISGKGAGTDVYSGEHRVTAVNLDIGGGTSNLALFSMGDTVDTGCLDVGGRLIRLDRDTLKITYIAPKLLRIIEAERLALAVGRAVDSGELGKLLSIMTAALEQSVGLRDDCKYYEMLITNHGLRHGTGNRTDARTGAETTEGHHSITCISFSGGVAAILYHPKEYTDDYAFGDIGIRLAAAIRQSLLFRKLTVIESAETIRATVVGAGSHTTEISGSTIDYANAEFPIKNLPVLKLTAQEEQRGCIAAAVRTKLSWFSMEGKLSPLAIALEGERNPSFTRVREYAEELLEGLSPILAAGLTVIVVVRQDMAKVLGQTMRQRMGETQKDTAGRTEGQREALHIRKPALICIDGIHLTEGDYIDIGRPAAGGSVLPVVVKTLVFQT